jgi:hypothetical protein
VTRRVKWLGSLGLVVALGAGAASALATGAAAKPRSVTAQVVTAPVKTATFDFTLSISGIGKHMGAVTLAGTGQADFVNDAVSVSVTLPAGVAKLIPGGSASPEVVNAVFSGGTVYLNVPSLASLVGDPWVSVALPSSAATGLPGIFTQVGSALGNVNEILAFARAHHATVTALAPSTVDGTSVTGSQITAHLKGLHISATLWADSSDRLVQAVVNAGKGASASGSGLSATVNLSGYDAPATITAPLPSQVRSIPLSVVTGVLGPLLHPAHLHFGGAHFSSARSAKLR